MWSILSSGGGINRGIGGSEDCVGGVAEQHEDASSLDLSSHERSKFGFSYLLSS